MLIIILYGLLLSALAIYSYGFVDPNLTFSTNSLYQKFHQPLFELVFNHRLLSTIIFVLIIFLLSIFYLLFSVWTRRKTLGIIHLRWLIGLTVGMLLLSYPAFSHDIFNYILTAKVTFFYHENPYIVMPIELLGEPNLAFTRATNKIALYGPSWIGLTVIPHIVGFGNILLTLFSFKALVAGFYLGVVWVVWKISKNLLSVALFALNPLVIIETLVSVHNDIVMMFFTLLAFHLLKKRNIIYATLFLLTSIFIKYATLFLLPVFLYVLYQTLKKSKINWEKIYIGSTFSMLLVFTTSPIREEIYPWYVIWILSFAVLIPKQKVLLSLVIVLSLATLLRYVPVLYTGSYFGITPLIKEVVTLLPIISIGIVFLYKKFAERFAR